MSAHQNIAFPMHNRTTGITRQPSFILTTDHYSLSPSHPKNIPNPAIPELWCVPVGNGHAVLVARRALMDASSLCHVVPFHRISRLDAKQKTDILPFGGSTAHAGNTRSLESESDRVSLNVVFLQLAFHWETVGQFPGNTTYTESE